MKKTILLIISIIFLGCGKEDNPARKNEDFNSKYGGIPYKGTVHGSISLQGDGLDLSGDGTIALIEDTKDSVSIVFLADIDDLGEINIKIRGRFDRKSFYFEDENSDAFFRIIDETINGRFSSDAQEMSFNGNWGHERCQMKMKVMFKQETDSFPKGTRFELNFDTRRKIENNDGSGCQMRMVPIWGPNGMTMGMVPDC